MWRTWCRPRRTRVPANSAAVWPRADALRKPSNTAPDRFTASVPNRNGRTTRPATARSTTNRVTVRYPRDGEHRTPHQVTHPRTRPAHQTRREVHGGQPGDQADDRAGRRQTEVAVLEHADRLDLHRREGGPGHRRTRCPAVAGDN